MPARPPLPDLRDVFGAAPIGLAVLFGSRARGEAHAGSDVDIGVLAGDGRSLPYALLGRLHVALGTRLGAHVDVVDLSTPDAVFRREVASVGEVLFEDRPGRFKEFVARALVDHDDVAAFLPALVRGVARRAAEGRRNR